MTIRKSDRIASAAHKSIAEFVPATRLASCVSRSDARLPVLVKDGEIWRTPSKVADVTEIRKCTLDYSSTEHSTSLD